MSNKALAVFGNTIRKYRELIDISQEELAGRAGLHRTYIGSVERGERNIGLLNIVEIARALKIEPSQLLKNLGTTNDE